MCLFKKENFKEAKKANALVGAGIATIILSILLPIIIRPCENLMPVFTSAQLAISAVGLILVIVALCFTMEEFQKSMAKPRIKVAFNEKREQQATLTYKDGKPSGLPALWLINEGNAISRYFQIDFIIPENIGKPSVSNFLLIPYVSFVKDDGEYILSYTNDGRYTLFVNRPYREPNTRFPDAIDSNKCIEVYKDSFEIKYRIYGDWGEPQEGKLKVNINKQQEVA
jgi:hypothetical protein